MIELSATTQEVATKENVLFDTLLIKSGCAERHRPNSGIITLVAGGRYLVSFSGNIAVPTDGTAGAISLALTVDGEALTDTTMTVTPTVVDAFFNVSVQRYIDVPRCGSCCVNVSVENVTESAIDVTNANISAVRVNG